MNKRIDYQDPAGLLAALVEAYSSFPEDASGVTEKAFAFLLQAAGTGGGLIAVQAQAGHLSIGLSPAAPQERTVPPGLPGLVSSATGYTFSAPASDARQADGDAGDANVFARLANLREQTVQVKEALQLADAELDETNRGVVALYAELDERAVLLQRSSELKTRYLANMSHELRTPLNSILALVRLMLDRIDGPLSPEQEKQVCYIQRSANELLQLVNDLLDIAKVEAGRLVVHPAWFEIGDLFGALRGVLRPLLINDQVRLIFEEPTGATKLHSDEGKVAQILRNLVSNALKFTEAGEVRVSASFSRDGEQVHFAVSDTGIGIAPEYHESIFEEFVQVEGPWQSQIKGTGLGLPLSKRLAHLLGGDITLKSEPGKGSLFCVTLPTNFAITEQPPTQRTQASTKTILLIDDDEVSRYVMRALLRDYGEYKIIDAESGPEGLRLAHEEQPAVIILDLHMPEMDGFRVLRELKHDKQTAGIPVIVNTSHVLADEQAQFIEQNAVAFVPKKTSSRDESHNLLEKALAKAGVS